MSLTKVTYSMIKSAPANVLDFGAVADSDGVTGTDNSAAFTAAMASGAKTVYIPVGRYLLGSPLAIPGGVSLIGENRSDSGLNGVILYASGGTASDTFLTKLSGSGIGANDHIENIKVVNISSYGKGTEYTNDGGLTGMTRSKNLSVFGFGINCDIFNVNSLRFEGCIFNNPTGAANVIIGTGYRTTVGVYANAIVFSKCSFDAVAGSGDKYNVLIGTASSTYAISTTYVGDLAGVTFTDGCEFTSEKDAIVVAYGGNTVVNIISNYFEQVTQDAVQVLGPSTVNIIGNYFSSGIGDNITYFPLSWRSTTIIYRGLIAGNTWGKAIYLPSNYLSDAVNYSNMSFIGNRNDGSNMYANVDTSGGKGFTQWPLSGSDMFHRLAAKQVISNISTTTEYSIIGAPASTAGFPPLSSFPAGSVTMYLDEAGSNIKFYVVTSGGVVKTATLAYV